MRGKLINGVRRLFSLFPLSPVPYGYMPIAVHEAMMAGLHAELERERARAKECQMLAAEAERYALAHVNIKLPRRSA